MRSFFTSSLDKIDPPAPFVNAMNWEAYRSQFRSVRSKQSGNRNCSMASCSLNPDLSELSGSAYTQFILRNTVSSPFTIEIQSESKPLSTFAVDECFEDSGLEFLAEKSTTTHSESNKLEKNSFELELGLLESVQEIAIALARTTPKRTVAGTLG